MRCARCGRETDGDAPPCTACMTPASLPSTPSPGGRRIAATAAAVVLVLASAAAGVAFATAGDRRPAAAGQVLAHPGDLRAASDSTRSAAGSADGSGSAASTGSAGSTGAAAGQPAPAASPGPSARPVVGIAFRAGAQPHAAAADTFLGSYFTAINDHDYRAYLHLFSPESRGALSRAGFQAGYGTTHDSAERLTELAATAPGRLAATVTFTSHQSPASGPAHAGCLRWNITVYLVRRGGRYVIGNPPAGYFAKDQPC
jgi:hypothetical protein